MVLVGALFMLNRGLDWTNSLYTKNMQFPARIWVFVNIHERGNDFHRNAAEEGLVAISNWEQTGISLS